MTVRKFVGQTSRDVLRQVRDELGPEAMIIANRGVAEGIEITAMPGTALASMLEPTPTKYATSPEPPVVLAEITAPMEDRLMREVTALRGMLETQLAQLAWGDTSRRQPLRAKFTRELLAAGYSALLVRELVQRLPDDYDALRAGEWITGVIAKNLHCPAVDDDIVTRGGVYALIGPTGVGKTTTTAKLAARCAVRYGARELALLTTDTYRVGAHDQLRIYAKILGVAVHTISNEHDLDQALDSLRPKHLVLIDTVGMSQRDERVAEQGLLLDHPDIARLLVMNATVQGETQNEVVTAYRGQPQKGDARLAGCILSKVDEAARLGDALDVAIRHGLLVHYVSNGQRVPEDLHPATASYLVHRSLKTRAPSASSPFVLADDDIGLVMASATEALHA